MSSQADSLLDEHEAELLLLCCRPAIDDATAAQIEQLQREDLDWESIIDEAREQGVVSLVYAALNARGPASVAQESRAELHRLHLANAARNLSLLTELRRLLSLLADEGIRAIPVKGPSLAVAAYGRLEARKAGDLDIFIPSSRSDEARALLLSLGYVPDISPSEAAMPGIHHLSLIHPESKFNVELHWSLNPEHFRIPQDFEDLWRRTGIGSGQLHGIVQLAPEDLLIYLCAHGGRHAWQHLLWVADIAHLVHAHDQLDWKVVFQRAQELRAVRLVNLGLALAQRQLELPLPQDIAILVSRDRVAHRLARRAAAAMFCPAPSLLRRLRFVRATRESRHDRARYLRYATRRIMQPNEADRGMAKLPAHLNLAYYLLRPVRLLTGGPDDSSSTT